MKKRIAVGIRIGLSLLLFASLLPMTPARERSAPTNRLPNKRLVPPKPAKETLTTKRKIPAVAGEQGLPPVAPGQSATLLADGSWLLVGGEGELLAAAAIADAQTGEIQTLPNKLRYPRAAHTATVMPDGTILVLGGIGPRNKYVENAEIFNPELRTFEPAAITGLTPRANHTTTLLSDGQLLVAGGANAKGRLTTEVELWNPQQKRVTVLNARLSSGRQKHVAALQADGSVVLSGGLDENDNNRTDAEIYQPESKTFVWNATGKPRPDDSATNLEFSSPNNGSMEVDENTLITLRFSKPLLVRTINRERVVLQGPRGEVETKVVAAEGGMLIFVTPLAPLATGSNYNLTISGASDQAEQPLRLVVVGFKTRDCISRSGENTCGSAPVQFTDLDTWIPDGKNLNGDWRSGRPNSQIQSLPALKAAAGETALAGQVLTLSGNPLPNVTLQIGDRLAGTDATGRFLLSSLTSGRQVLTIHGHSASRPGKTYGTFDVLTDVTAGKTTVLPYTIWLPVLDEQSAVRLSIPTARETAVTTPRVPGMEVRIPSSAVLRMPKVKHQVHAMKRELTSMAITPIPIDRPPFPLPPGVDDGLLFTLQLHGAKVEGLNGEKRAGLRIVFPNYQQLSAGARVDFWNYDPEEGGWYMYGHGTVTADRRQVVPDPGVELQSMHCISLMNKGDTPDMGPAPGDGRTDGDPVDLGTGLFVYNRTDLVIPDVIPLSFSRTYRPLDPTTRSFGKGSTNPYDMYISGDTYNYGQIVMPDGGLVRFNKIPNTAIYEHTSTPTRFYKATMKQVAGVGPNGAWEVRLKDGTVYQFGIKVLWGDIFGPHSTITALSAIQDRYGNRLIIIRDDSFRIAKIISPNGRSISLSYSDSSKRVSQISDNSGRSVSYTYDAPGRLWKVTDVKGGITEYTYDTADRMLSIKDPRGIVYLVNEYDANGRVSRQTQADTGVYQFAYTLDGSGKITQTNVTDPRGFVRRVTFNSDGYALTDTIGLGQPEEQTYSYERQAATNLTLSVTDPIGRKTAMTYDAQGNMISFTRLADTSSAVTTNITYEPNYQQVATVTDPLGHTVSYAHNVRGSLRRITNPLGQHTSYRYNAAAQLTSVTDPLGNTSWFDYQAGGLQVTDPLNRTSRTHIDSVGRITRMIGPMGDETRFQYDSFNQPTVGIDPLQGVSASTYDANGNLKDLTDARNNVTRFTYNNMDRLATRTDPLLHEETYEYDLNGNLTRSTDRKGQVTNYTYDAINRLTGVTYADLSTITCSYDSVNRLTEVVDSNSGTITYGHDALDRLVSEATPQGTISYTYDADDRRISMTVAGQPAVNYTYDDAHHLTQITQGATTVAITYNNAGLRSSLTLPNGIVTHYGYDSASQLTSLTYKLGQTVLGDITYEYDANGRRSRMGGSWAGAVSPEPLSSASYNAANQQLSFGAQTLSYDLNGNLTGDGTNTYNWDARNRLVSINGPHVSAGFQYDAVGRRRSTTVNGTMRTFLFDGPNIVQEQSAQIGNANLLTGRLDEIFMRSDSSGLFSPLVDGLGSSRFLTDSAGATQTQYSYGVFGQTASAGLSSNNSAQFTARDNDGTGLQYNRARYYSPLLQRFLSEDPMDFGGGDTNLYAYVSNNPANFVDPLGLQGNTHDFGLGWSGRLDQFSSGTGFEIHVFDPRGVEAGIVSGRDGWIGKHGFPDARPPNIPDDVVNKINGLNVGELRRRGAIPEKGTPNVNIRRGGYLNPGRRLFSGLNVVSTALSFFEEYEMQKDLEMRGRYNGISPECQFFKDSERAGHPPAYMTPFGAMPNPHAYGMRNPCMLLA